MLLPIRNPNNEQIKVIFSETENGSLNWLKDSINGDLYYWPADSSWLSHKVMADSLSIHEYEKGTLTTVDI